MKIKNSLRNKNVTSIRKLKPKTQPCQEISIQSLSFSYSNCGTTFVKINPSEIIITSSNLIEMIETKKESIPIENNVCVLRDDLLSAIQNHSCDESKGNVNNIESKQYSDTRSDEPKRPTNAFILYRNSLRKKIKALFPSFSNSDISKFTGAMWRAAKDDVKEKYIKQAKECRILHKEKYPNFEYSMKKEVFEDNASNSIDDSTSFNYWNYDFDWSPQITPNELDGSYFDCMNSSKNAPVVPWDLLNINSGTLDMQNITTVEQQQYQDWNDVCNIVSQFFPEDSNHNTLIDDKLWASLSNIELSNDGVYELASFLQNDSLRFGSQNNLS